MGGSMMLGRIPKVMTQAIDKETVAEVADDFRIVFTPFHGTGHKLAPEALRAQYVRGKRHVHPNVHCSTVYNSQDMETTWMSISR